MAKMKSINAKLKENESGHISITVQLKAKTFGDKDNFDINKMYNSPGRSKV